MTTTGNLLDIGLRDYVEVLNLQRKLVELRATKTIPDSLILVEHPNVFTVGKGVTTDVPTEISGVPVVRVERGGHWTYHGPGQLVGYPILDIDNRQRDIHGFLRNMEEALILALGKFGLQAGRGEQTGVWVGSKKIASIGAAIRNWTSFHGFGLNVNTDLHYFHMITPCGFPGSTMTSMQALLGKKRDFDAVKREVGKQFGELFELQLVEVGPDALEAMAT
jgi:lipoate-protein ligase B